jgi:hypothetical protein
MCVSECAEPANAGIGRPAVDFRRPAPVEAKAAGEHGSERTDVRERVRGAGQRGHRPAPGVRNGAGTVPACPPRS